MKFCSKCGMEIADDVAFCPGCGSPVGNEAPAQSPAPQQPVYQQPVNPAPAAPAAPRKTPVFSILGFIFSLISLPLFFIGAGANSPFLVYFSMALIIVGLVFSIIGIAKRRLLGMAIVGLIFSIIDLIIVIIILAVGAAILRGVIRL